MRKLCATLLLAALALPLRAQAPAFSDNFSRYANGSDGAPTWQPFLGKWAVRNGQYEQTVSDQYDQGSSVDVKPTGRYTISVTTKSLGGPAGGGLFWNMSRRDTRNNCQMVRVDPDFVIWGYEDAKGDFQQTGICNTCGVAPDTWHTLSVAVDPELGKYNVLLDGKIVGRNADLRFFDGYVGIESALANAFKDFEVRPATAAELEGLKIAEPFNAPQSLAYGYDGRLYVAHRGKDTVAVVDPATGAVERSFAPRGRADGEVLDPTIIRLHGGEVWVLDRMQNHIAVFGHDGAFVRNVPVAPDTRDFLLVEGARKDAGTPGTPPVRTLVAIVTTDGTSVRVTPPDGRNGTSVGPFKDLQALAMDRAGRILAGDAGDETIKFLAFRADGPGGMSVESAGQIPGWLNPHSIAVNSKNQIVHLGGLGYYEPWGAVRLIDQEGRRIAHFAGFSIGNFGQTGGIAVGPDDTTYLADADNNRIIVIPPDFNEPRPHVEVAGDTATITWKTDTESSLRILPTTVAYEPSVSKDPNRLPPLTSSTLSPQALATTDAAGTHRAVLTGLQPNTSYDYSITPTVRTIPATPQSKRYSFLSAPPTGKVQYVTLKVITAIYLKTVNNGKHFALPKEQLGDRVQRMFARGREFYWRNTHFKVNLDIDYTVIEDTEADIKDAIPPLDTVKKDIQRSAGFAGKDISKYDSVIAAWVGPNYSNNEPEAVGEVHGGGLTPYGYSAFS